MRYAGRMLIQLRKEHPDIGLYDALTVANFDKVISATKAVCKTDTTDELAETSLKIGRGFILENDPSPCGGGRGGYDS